MNYLLKPIHGDYYLNQVKLLKLRLLHILILILLTIIFYHVSSFFLTIDLCFIIPAVIAQIFIPIAGTVLPIEIPTKEAKSEMEKHLLIAETTISKCYI